jgi:hypothetical protein
MASFGTEGRPANQGHDLTREWTRTDMEPAQDMMSSARAVRSFLTARDARDVALGERTRPSLAYLGSVGHVEQHTHRDVRERWRPLARVVRQ